MDTSTLGSGVRGARILFDVLVVDSMSSCIRAVGVDTFCPPTVLVRCVNVLARGLDHMF